MKKLIFIVASILGVACGKPAEKNTVDNFTSKRDTVEVLIRATKGGIVYVPVVAAYQTFVSYTPKDSLKPSDTMARIKSFMDTVWMVKDKDTLRNARHAPVYDSLHNVVFQPLWRPIDKRFIQIISVPR